MVPNSKINIFLTFVLLLVGFGVFLFSLYVASVSGLMNKIGLIGGDLRQSVDTNKLYRGMQEYGGVTACRWWDTTKLIPIYLFKDKDERVELGRELGKERRNCAYNYLLAGNTERGVYTLLKGLKYERANLEVLLKIVEVDKAKCLIEEVLNYGDIEAYLEAADGSAGIVIQKEYDEIGNMRNRLDEMCKK